MKLVFGWTIANGEPSPTCSSDVVNKDGVSPLCCLLTDDGGQRFLDTISWLSEGLDRIKSVKDFYGSHADWSRDAWGAGLTQEQAKIYSLHDEDYFEMIDIESFEAAVSTWRSFIQQRPESETILELRI
jgi:hypothetical protein